MKKVALILVFILLLSPKAYADVCVEVNDKSAAKAAELIKSQKEIYDYCSICNDAIPQVIRVKNVKYDKKVYVNDNAIDLAHIYFKQGNKYLNFGIVSGCIEDGAYGISATLDNLTEFHHIKENDKEQAKQKAKAIFDKCVKMVENDKSKTMKDMIERNIKINNCLAEAIKQEIQKGFDTEQQAQMLQNLEQARKGIWNFYNDIYTDNKYCYGQCGSITSLLPYSDEGFMLMQMLERLLYINIAKKGIGS